MKLRDKALQALGQLFIARPALMLLKSSAEVTRSALAPTAPLLLKHRMLLNLTELLKVRRLAQLPPPLRGGIHAVRGH